MEKKIRYLFFILLFLICSCFHNKIKYYPNEVELSNEAYASFYYLKFLDYIKEYKYESARSAIEKALSYRSDPYLYLEYAKLLISQGKIKEAEEILKKGLQKNPGNRELIFFLSDIYIHEKKNFNAYELLKTYIKEKKDDVEARKKIASLLLKEKQYKIALNYLSEVKEKARDEMTYFLMAKCYEGLNQRKKSIENLIKATKKNPEFLRAWAELAYEYELEGDLVSAEKVYSRLLSTGVSNRDLVLRLMEINLKLGKYDKAYEVANSYLTEPKDILLAVSICLKEEAYNEAEKLLKTILNFGDEYPEIIYYKAYIKFKKYNDISGAIEELNKITRDKKIYKNALDLKIKLLLKKKDYHGIEKVLKNEIKNNKYNGDLYLYLSEVYLLTKKYDDAINILNEYLKIRPNNVDVLFQLGTIYYKKGDVDKALSIMEKIIAINPNHASALNFIGYTLIDEQRDIKKGFELVSKAVRLEPKNGYFIDSLAWYYYKIKDYKTAWKYIQDAVRYVDNDPTIWEHYGDIALKLNKINEAKKAYKKALKNNHEDPAKIKRKLKELFNNTGK